MANEKKGKRGGTSQLSRSTTITVRLEPKLRYLAGLAARKHRRTLSAFCEWSLQQALTGVFLSEIPAADGTKPVSLISEAEELWDIDEADRFAKLAFRHSELLTHEEMVMWKAVRESERFWRTQQNEAGEPAWQIDEVNIRWEQLRGCWNLLKDIGAGRADSAVLFMGMDDSGTVMEPF